MARVAQGEMQNAGDFSGYEALYAQRFQGIKRVGTNTYRLRDRVGNSGLSSRALVLVAVELGVTARPTL